MPVTARFSWRENAERNKQQTERTEIEPQREPLSEQAMTRSSTTEEDRATERYSVFAKRWKHGWELHIEGLGVTQSKTLATADAMVRDYIESLTDRAVPSDAIITITPDLGAIAEQVTNMNDLYALADRSEREAAKTKKKIVFELRSSGYSVTDMAVILGVTRARVSQLLRNV